MTDNIYNSELVSKPEINEDELFVRVENDMSSSEKIDAPAYSYWRSVFRSFFRKPSNIIALVFLFIIIGLAYIQPLFSGFVRMGNILGEKNIPPFQSFEHIFGTDGFGDDLFDLTWVGTRFSLSLAIVATTITMVAGILVGALWGYSKFFDKIFTELYNIIANVPGLVVTIIIVYAIGNSFWDMVLAFTCTGWLGIGYSFRTQVIIIRDRDYNLASRCLGTSTFRMITHNILPFLVSIIVTYVSNYLPSFIGQEVFLSYIKVAMDKSNPSLGAAIQEGIAKINDPSQAHIFWIPVAVSAIVTITLYISGQGLADASDPRNHR